MPDRVGGKPALGNSRVPAELVADYDQKLADVLKFKLYRDSNKPAAVQP